MGKVKIIERDNLEKILNEQKLQFSGLVNESQAANIGNIAGVEYVCYGTIKEIENGQTTYTFTLKGPQNEFLFVKK